MPKPLFSNPALTSAAPAVMPNTIVHVGAAPMAVVPAYKPITIAEIADLGGGSSKSAATISDKIIQSGRTIDMDDLGKLMLNTVKTAQGFDPTNIKKGGILGLFKNKVKDLQLRFDTVDDTIKRNVAEINKRCILFRNRIKDLEQMKIQLEKDRQNIKAVVADIRARVAWMESNVPDVAQGDLKSSQAKSDWLMAAAMGTKRADDLTRLLMLFDQQDATISQMQQNAAALAQKMSDLETTSVPAMKMAFTNYMLQLEMKKGAEFADAQDAMTNAAINKAAELHGQNTTAIYTSLTRSNIELSTLQNNQNAIISSLNEGERLVAEMKIRLSTEAPQLEQLSADLCAQLNK